MATGAGRYFIATKSVEWESNVDSLQVITILYYLPQFKRQMCPNKVFRSMFPWIVSTFVNDAPASSFTAQITPNRYIAMNDRQGTVVEKVSIERIIYESVFVGVLRHEHKHYKGGTESSCAMKTVSTAPIQLDDAIQSKVVCRWNASSQVLTARVYTKSLATSM